MIAMIRMVFVCVACSATVAATNRPAFAQDSAPRVQKPSSEKVRTARSHFDRAVELYYEEDYPAALVEFRRAYVTAPHFQILYNIATCHLALRDYAKALRAFRRFLRDGGKRVDRKTRKEVRAQMRTLAGRTARLKIDARPPGTEIRIDDVLVGESPLKRAVLVNIGRHRIDFSHPLHVAASRRIEVAGGDTRIITIDLLPLASTKTELPAAPESVVGRGDEVSTEANTPLLVSLGLTGALTAAAAVTGVLALQASNRRDDARADVPVDAEEFAREDNRAQELGIATDVLIGSAVVAAGFSLYFALSGDETGASTSSDPDSEHEPGGGGVELWFTGRSLSVTTRF